MPLNDLIVNVSANTGDLSKGLRKGLRDQRKFGRDSERIGNKADRRGGGRRGGGLFGRAFGGKAGGLAKGLGVAGVAIGAVTAATQVPAAIKRAAVGARDKPAIQKLFQTSAQAAHDEWVISVNRRINRTIKEFGKLGRAVGGGRGEALGQGIALLASGQFKEGLSSLRAGFDPSRDPDAARLRGATTAARQAFEQRRRVSGAAARFSQAEAAALAGQVTRQSGRNFDEQILAQITKLVNIAQNRSLTAEDLVFSGF